MADYKRQTKVKLDDKIFMVSTIYDPFFDRYETMIFECDRYGDILSWSEMYVDYYKTEEEAEKGHEDCVKNTKEKLRIGV